MFAKVFATASNGGRLEKSLFVALAMTAVLLGANSTPAGPPWRSPPTSTYSERVPETPPPAKVSHAPVRYTITVTVLPLNPDTHKQESASADQAEILAHLPEGAPLWIGGEATTQREMERHFSTPALTPGKKYSYDARVVWFEDGKWVQQTVKVPVWAGRTTCLFLTKPSAVAEALGELGPEDRKLASGQKYCPVQPQNPLGAMGKPIKVMLEGKPVFLCCEGCQKEASKSPEKTLAKAKELTATNAPSPKK